MVAEVEMFRLTAFLRHAGTILLGCGCFGFAAGAWRSPLQGFYTGIKLPVILLVTAFGNALINGMLAPLFGVALDLRRSLAAVLLSYSIASILLGGIAPLIGFIVWNLAPLDSSKQATRSHDALLLSLIVAIAFSGVIANHRLVTLLRQLSTNSRSASRLFWSWLTINFILGSQLSWISRPFIGAPRLAVRFVRADALHGNFYETVAHLLKGFFAAR